MAATQRYTYTVYLCSLILLLNALTAVSSAGDQQKLADAFEAATTRHSLFFNRWAVGVDGGPENADKLARKHGLTNRGQIGNLKGVYLFTDGKEASGKATKTLSEFSVSKTTALRGDEQVNFLEQQKLQIRTKKVYTSPTDPGWKKQWSLENTGQTSGPPGLDLNVEPVWMQGVTGRGVVVGFVDDGLEWRHRDLLNNYDEYASYDFVWYDYDPTPDVNSEEPNRHGTSCAGEVAMGKNHSCGVGVAYDCNIGGLKVDLSSASDSVEAEAVGYKDSHIHIYSNSWGPTDYGFIVDGPGTLLAETFSNGAREGRNGKGSIYIWAAGNGGNYYDSCAADGYVNSIYTIAVGSADQNGRQADYDEDCSAKMAVTFSYNSDTFPGADDEWDPYKQIYTTTLGGKCTDDFTGTSASAPLVSGVMALVLQANPDLTWRDVQYLIAYTSNPDILTGGDWVTNGAGLKVSHHFGFGAIDAEAMVTRARHWTNVPDQHKQDHFPPTTYLSIYPHSPNDASISVSHTNIGFLEHVVITLSISLHNYGRGYDYDDFDDEVNYYANDVDDVYNWLEDDHPRRGDIKIELTAPSGTKSVLLPYRNYDFINELGYDDWPFMSVHFWGENPLGTWRLKTTYKSNSGHLSLSNIKMTLYGTQQTPTIIANIPSSCHSSCARGCFGEGPENCDVCNNLRLSSTLECVEECPNGTHAYKQYCISGLPPEDETSTPESETNSPESKTNPIPLAISISGGVLVLLIMIAIACGLILRFYIRKKERTVRFRRLQNIIET